MKKDSYILNDFFDRLNRSGANYCVMNNYIDMPEVIPSDVDFAVDWPTYKGLDCMVSNLAADHGVAVTQKIWHGYNKCAFILSPLRLEKRFWLQLDFFVDFSGRGFPNLLPIRDMLHEKRKYKNFFIPSVDIEVPFLWQRRIFKSELESRHVVLMKDLLLSDEERVKSGIRKVFGEEIGNDLIEMTIGSDLDKFKHNIPYLRRSLAAISRENTSILYRMKYATWQVIRAFYRVIYPTGLSVAFLGKKSRENDDFVKKFDQLISGSFHGTRVLRPTGIFDYFILMLTKGTLSKITKRKVLIHLDDEIFPLTFFKEKFVKRILPMPDVLFTLPAIGASKGEMDENTRPFTLNEFVSTALKKQEARTKRHMMARVSPTARTKLN